MKFLFSQGGFEKIILVMLVLFVPGKAVGTPLFGPVPLQGAGGEQVPPNNFTLPSSPNQAVPQNNGPGFNAPNPSGNGPSNGSGGTNPSPSRMQNQGVNPQGGPGNTNGSQVPASTAPTFMNGYLPNTSNPFLPQSVSSGLLSSPLENAYLQNGVPILAAPLMSTVYRPFGLTYFQPNPFMVTPQGQVSLTGTFETDTNINYSPTHPEVGSLYSIMPAVMYTNFDDYGFVSLLANASYYGYDTGNIPPYLDETGGITTGTYLGQRIFVGLQDLIMDGSSPQLNGQPLAFFNGINPFFENMANGEVGVALTPKITFVEAASDNYVEDQGFLMNLQSLMETLNYMDKNNYLSGSYIYQQGNFTGFPGFISNGGTGTALRKISATTSIGVGGSFYDYLYQNAPLLNMNMFSYYGMITHQFTRSFFGSFMGGWNGATFNGGQSFQAPMGDINLGYTAGRFNLGLNAGYFIMNNLSYGVEMGPEKTEMVIGTLSYTLSPKTTFVASGGWTYYNFLLPAPFVNGSNFFSQPLQTNISYDGTYISQTDMISYTPYSWLQTSLIYNLLDFTTNIPNVTVIDNQFVAMVSFFWNFK
jgi:hypothetical protein